MLLMNVVELLNRITKLKYYECGMLEMRSTSPGIIKQINQGNESKDEFYVMVSHSVYRLHLRLYL
ncbi:hypothetical protein M514_08733 [Trichuris suis]|uniref:Uncharacterized protein n=1 Tax=Trichuris suis TaxID=68888 RepID=A0A085N7D1_9BILA|nr:hypothetical protein M513_08733 [Trichuris suis]KFD65377.1 hypothetical protein M514_08733 [Trichuris suis]KHJ45048.1 hypothetical protein D918_04859 [Trichuris suis]